MSVQRTLTAALTAIVLVVATPAAAVHSEAVVQVHVLTGMHELCYGSRCYHPEQRAPLREIAPWLTWALADPAVSEDARKLGVHTYAYIDPSIQYDPARDYSPFYSGDESTFLHSCDGARAAVKRGDVDGNLMDVGAPAYRARVRAHVDAEIRGHYDALFVDDVFAANHTYATVTHAACGRTYERERDATYSLWTQLGMPVIFNGLGDAPDDGRTEEHLQAALDGPSVIGGMYEFCLTGPDDSMDHTVAHKRVDGAWRSAQNSHLAAVAGGKLFLCYAASATPGDTDAGRQERAYVYASFLLVYRPDRSVLEMAAGTARRRVSVFPESTLVALDPVRPRPAHVEDLQGPGGAYVRAYAHCFVRGVPAGACAAVVNSSASRSATVDLRGYERVLALHGGALLDGGTVALEPGSVRSLPPASGAVVFR
jgi:hypothetical protein